MLEYGLGRQIHFDERSRAFPIRTIVGERIPRGYTWRCGVVLDQGSEGSCVGHAWAHELIARPVVTLVDHTYARERIYWEAQKIDPWDGGAYPGAAPFYEGTAVLAGAKVCQALGHFAEYRWAFGLRDLILAVGYTGPVVLGINWYEGMFNPDVDGFIRPTGLIAGGHALLVHGVSVSGSYVKIHNSWGPSWGQNGGAKITFTDLERLLNEDGEACIPLRRHARVLGGPRLRQI